MMNALKRLSQSIGFTPAESRVAVFLVAMFLLGAGIKLYRAHLGRAAPFDYAAVDAEFARFANQGAASDSLRSAAAPGAADTTRGSWERKSGKKLVPSPRSINLNTAPKEELMKLPGIGETTAERIVQYRRDHGPFSTLEDVMNVKGIGKKKFERIAPSCFIGK